MSLIHLIDADGNHRYTGKEINFKKIATLKAAGMTRIDEAPPANGHPQRWTGTEWVDADKATQYQRDRAEAYPPLADFADAEVKIASGDPALAAEGKAQKAVYVAACLAVKAAHPKPAP